MCCALNDTSMDASVDWYTFCSSIWQFYEFSTNYDAHILHHIILSFRTNLKNNKNSISQNILLLHFLCGGFQHIQQKQAKRITFWWPVSLMSMALHRLTFFFLLYKKSLPFTDLGMGKRADTTNQNVGYFPRCGTAGQAIKILCSTV